MENLFETYNRARSESLRLQNQISRLVENYIDKTVGIVIEDDSGNPDIIGKTMKGQISWSIIDSDKISITYSPIANRYIDYWDEDVYITISYDELMNIETN